MSRVEPSQALSIDRIVFIGRTFEEYIDLFNLEFEHLRGKRILDCPAGACSFTARANELGVDVTACDIVYDHPVESLEKKGHLDIEHVMGNMEQVKGNYNWNYFKDINSLKTHRLEALKTCVADMKKAAHRYFPAVLPELPFDNEAFDVLLSAHFLFMYSDRFDLSFHIQTLKEMLRVTKEEIRIFPLVDLKGERYGELNAIIDYLKEQGCTTEEVPVQYEFQVNANSMLKIQKGK